MNTIYMYRVDGTRRGRGLTVGDEESKRRLLEMFIFFKNVNLRWVKGKRGGLVGAEKLGNKNGI